MRKTLLWAALAVFLSGCASVFNPYESKFHCPPTDPGKCVSLQTAYQESLQPTEGAASANTTAEGTDEDLYLREKFEVIRSLIREPKPPVVRPPKVIRVLILSYVGRSNTLYGWRYVYFFADEPSWVIDAAGEVVE